MHRIFTRLDLVLLLQSSSYRTGVETIELTPNGNFFEYMAQELRRVKNVSEKYTSKKLHYIHCFNLYRFTLSF